MRSINSLGRRIRDQRKARGMTQEQLAARVGIGQPALSSIETGDSKWLRGGNLLRIAAALDVDPLWLETGHGDPRPAPIPADYTIHDVYSALTDDNRRRLVAVAQALLADQTQRPSAADPFPNAPKPPAKPRTPA